MASTSTLSRRRNNAHAADSSTTPLDSTSSSSRPQTPQRTVSSSTGGGGHKVAYDERDLNDATEHGAMPRLTLMEEVLLLGLKDKQGYLSFWNDNISYTLRGCIVLELALRHRIAMVRDPNRRRFPLADRYIEVVDDRPTGEVLLDEALKMMKVSERMSVGTWIDLMSGETWNVMKIGYQLKQVRERLAKGLVDKGVLRTEKRNFLLFDMATHPVSDPTFKDDVLRRTLSILTTRTTAVPTSNLYGDHVRYRTIRAVSMVCAAFAANVLENALVHLSYDQRELAFSKCDELLAEFSQWPFGSVRLPSHSGGGMSSSSNGGGSSGGGGGTGIGTGGNVERMESANLAEINRLARMEIVGQNTAGGGSSAGSSSSSSSTPRGGGGGGASFVNRDPAMGPGADKQTMRELHLEVVAAVLEVYRRMDSLL
ncbi:hypothetical protein JCM10212_006563 [Sporobolomyces blumeae]